MKLLLQQNQEIRHLIITKYAEIITLKVFFSRSNTYAQEKVLQKIDFIE